jgi:hypothetical protein
MSGREQGENHDPRRKGSRAGVLHDETPIDELEAMGEAEKTTRAKKSRVKLFLTWLESRDLKLPAKPRWVQWFAAALTKWEYQYPKQYTSSVIMWLVEPTKGVEQARLVSGPAVVRNITDVEDAINRTVFNNAPQKAKPLILGEHWNKLSSEELCIASTWALSSLRGDTFEGIWEQDVKVQRPGTTKEEKKEESIDIVIADDKVKNQQGRTITIGCNCDPHQGIRFCPLHGERRISADMFPVKKTMIAKICKTLRVTCHSFRRAFALAARERSEKIDTEKLAAHAGWEPEAKQWNTYTTDFHATWKAKMSEFMPYHGAFKGMEGKSGAEYPFTNKPKKTKVTIKLRAPQQAQRRGKGSAAKKVMLKKVLKIVKANAEKRKKK